MVVVPDQLDRAHGQGFRRFRRGLTFDLGFDQSDDRKIDEQHQNGRRGARPGDAARRERARFISSRARQEHALVLRQGQNEGAKGKAQHEIQGKAQQPGKVEGEPGAQSRVFHQLAEDEPLEAAPGAAPGADPLRHRAVSKPVGPVACRSNGLAERGMGAVGTRQESYRWIDKAHQAGGNRRRPEQRPSLSIQGLKLSPQPLVESVQNQPGYIRISQSADHPHRLI